MAVFYKRAYNLGPINYRINKNYAYSLKTNQCLNINYINYRF